MATSQANRSLHKLGSLSSWIGRTDLRGRRIRLLDLRDEVLFLFLHVFSDALELPWQHNQGAQSLLEQALTTRCVHRRVPSLPRCREVLATLEQSNTENACRWHAAVLLTALQAEPVSSSKKYSSCLQ